MKRITLTIALLFPLFSSEPNAAIVSVGFLSTELDGSSKIIYDNLNHREWLRWDVLAGLSYSEALTATTTGDYASYQIGNRLDAVLFVQAMSLGTNTCDTPGLTDVTCGSTGTFGSIFGSNYNSEYDYAWFRSQSVPQEVGWISIAEPSDQGDIRIDWAWDDIPSADRIGSLGSTTPVSWLMYKETESIPAPPLLLLFITGFFGLTWFTKRKKAVREISS